MTDATNTKNPTGIPPCCGSNTHGARKDIPALNDKSDCALQISGSSMEPAYHDGTILLVSGGSSCHERHGFALAGKAMPSRRTHQLP